MKRDSFEFAHDKTTGRESDREGSGVDRKHAPAGPQFMSGINALVRLSLIQKARDEEAGLNTGGFISGYRGSPLGGFDQQLWKNKVELEQHDIHFQPGLNEELAATAVWGSQIHESFGPTRTDGVFAIWYGKGPGVDRSGDALRHGNAVGTHKLGGVLAVAGDDHAAQSSTFAHQSDGIFHSTMIPVFYPSNVEEIVEYGLAGLALSRFSGLWVAMKTVAEVVESSAIVDLDAIDPEFVTPDIEVPAHGFNFDAGLNWPADRLEYERRLVDERMPAAKAWIAANKLNKPILSAKRPRLCLVTTGKAHQDVMQALADLGITQTEADLLGLCVFKYAVSWPVETQTLMDAFGACDEFLVVEEKQPILEDQIKAAFYARGTGRRPNVIGKFDENGRKLLPATGELHPMVIARALLERLERLMGERLQTAGILTRIGTRLDDMAERADGGALTTLAARKPYFCSGCPHNTSTKVPEGSIAGGGIGCHIMAVSIPDRNTTVFSQMGGEGMQWLGAHQFSDTKHVFQNLGDGTYAHSGSLAIRAAVAEGANITFKVLYNDAVAMTGGQPVEGAPSPMDIATQLRAEGVETISLVSDEPEKWSKIYRSVPGLELAHRDRMDEIQTAYRDAGGVSVIIYEQTCAAEKRRRRKRKEMPDPPKRVMINSRVCEGCGDCSVKSNCISVEPLETDFGPKRQINQSSCNKDFSCVKGFCPSFVELGEPELRKPDAKRIAQTEEKLFASLPDPLVPVLDAPKNIFVTGIGGLGVLTLGAIMGAAARYDDAQSTVLDFTGLAQKNGAVVSHVRLAKRAGDLHAVRIGDGRADVLLASDSLVAASPINALVLSADRTAAVINTNEAPTADNVMDRDFQVPAAAAVAQILTRVRSDRVYKFGVNELAEGLFGEAIAGNIMLLGYAWQAGLIPLSRRAIRAAIEQNGVAVKLNHRAFEWGRAVAHDMAAVKRIIDPAPDAPEPVKGFDRFVSELVAYQNEAYADRYRALIEATRKVARNRGIPGRRYLHAVEENAYKVMAYKDEYEVARLYSAPEYMAALTKTFSSWRKMKVWLAPPTLSLFGAKGEPKKRKFGAWVFGVFAVLKHMKGLRGTWADPFGKTDERRMERELREDYFALVEELNASLDKDNVHTAIALASIPKDIRGYGHVKLKSLGAAGVKWAHLLDEFRGGARDVGEVSVAPKVPTLEPAE